MQTTKQIGFSTEHTAIIDKWCRTYPYRKSIGLALIKANPEENAKLLEILSAGHTEKEVYSKGYYHRMNVIGDVAKKASLTKPRKKVASRMPGGEYKCYICGHISASKAHHSAHIRYEHPGQSRTAQERKKAGKEISVSTNGAEIGVDIPVNIPKALLNQWIIVSPDGSVKPVRLINACPECGDRSIKSHLVAHNI